MILRDRRLRIIAVALAVASAIVVAQNYLIARYFSGLPRFVTDFSPTYLQREIAALKPHPPRAIFVGDSVLWGFGLASGDTAVAALARAGCSCRNFAFKSGSPPNFYVVARLLESVGLHPGVVVLEINEKVFNESDPAYDHLHPAIEEIARPLLSERDLAALHVEPASKSVKERLDSALASIMLLYAMRADIRETVYGDVTAPIKPPTSDLLEGIYDLSPLSEQNVGVQYLDKTLAVFRRANIPVVAFITPANHALLHDYIDNPSYRSNLQFLTERVRAAGARVIDLDAAFPSNEFLDNDHLTPAGQAQLAAVLTRALP